MVDFGWGVMIGIVGYKERMVGRDGRIEQLFGSSLVGCWSGYQ